MNALIFESYVIDVKEEPFEVCPEMTWVGCPDDIKIGFSYEEGKFINPTLSLEKVIEARLQDLRKIRDGRLLKSDWSISLENHLSDEKRQEWKEYRQKLRDLPEVMKKELEKDINILFTWPIKPT
jgi:hypothetical protein